VSTATGPLAIRDFRRLWLASLLSLTGSQVSRIGLILGIVQTTNSVSAVALLVLVETLPSALLAPLAGAAVDRLGKRSLMIAMDLVRFMGLMVILAMPVPAVILTVACVNAIATCVFQPARTAAIPLVVPPDRIVAANSWDQGAANLMFILGPALGTELFVALGLRWTLVLDGVTYLASAALLAGVHGCDDARSGVGGMLASAASDIRGGWRYLRSHDLVLHLSALFFVSLVCAGLWTPLAPFFVRDVLGGTTRLLGWQFAAFGAGAVGGSLLAPPLVARLGRGALLSGALLAEGVCQTAYAASDDALASTALIVVWGTAVSLIVVPFYSILQTVVDAPFRGRVLSTVRQTENVATTLSLGVAALLHGYMNSQSILLAGGLAYCALVAGSCLTVGGRGLLATR